MSTPILMLISSLISNILEVKKNCPWTVPVLSVDSLVLSVDSLVLSVDSPVLSVDSPVLSVDCPCLSVVLA
jgi:hypothetical protein